MDSLAHGARLPRELRALPRGASRLQRPAGRRHPRAQRAVPAHASGRPPVIAGGLPGLQRKPQRLHAPPAVPSRHPAPRRVAREEPAALERPRRPPRRLARPFLVRGRAGGGLPAASGGPRFRLARRSRATRNLGRNPIPKRKRASGRPARGHCPRARAIPLGNHRRR